MRNEACVAVGGLQREGRMEDLIEIGKQRIAGLPINFEEPVAGEQYDAKQSSNGTGQKSPGTPLRRTRQHRKRGRESEGEQPFGQFQPGGRTDRQARYAADEPRLRK